MNKIVGTSIAVVLVVFLAWPLYQILIGLNQDLKLHLNLLMVGAITIMTTLLLAGLSFIWLWWTASEGQFGN